MAETTKILDISEVGFKDGLTSLCTDMNIGALLVPAALDARDLKTYKLGEGVTHSSAFDSTANAIANYFDTYDDFVAEERGSFNSGHPWHVFARTAEVPILRTWTHIRGDVTIFFARANTDHVTDAHYDASDEEVAEYIIASPVVFVPDPGDILVFVDQNTPKITGHPTFHKTEVPHLHSTNRISIAADITMYNQPNRRKFR